MRRLAAACGRTALLSARPVDACAPPYDRGFDALARGGVAPIAIGPATGKRNEIGADVVLAQDLERLVRWWCAFVREGVDALACLVAGCTSRPSLRASFLNERASWRGPVGRSPPWPTEAPSVLQSFPGGPAPPTRSAPCLPSHRERLSAPSWIARQLGRVPSNGQAMSPPCPGAGDAPMGHVRSRLTRK